MTILMQIMSRRKQSNPKPLIKRDDEDFPENETGAPVEQETEDDRASGASSPHTKTESHATQSPCHSPPISPTNDNNNDPDSGSVEGRDMDDDSNPPVLSRLRKRSIDEVNEQPTTPTTSPTSFTKSPEPPLFTVNCLPKLRLNTALASDPSTNPDAKSLKSMRASAVDEDFQDKIDENFNASQSDNHVIKEHVSATVVGRSSDKHPKSTQVLGGNLEMPPRLAMFVCGPCGIRFSSASTLEAHQTYYCSHRKDQDENGVTAKPSADGSLEPTPKSVKTGKQYACSQCSYSADKKVSLNRHMRMHQASPSPSSNASNGGDDVPAQLLQASTKQPPTVQLSQQQQLLLQQQLQQQQQQQQQQQAPVVQLPQIDRYCSDCDIRFSSTKTYRAHKLHYCSSRHREGGPVNNTASAPPPATAVKPVSSQKSGSQSPTENLAKSPPTNSSSQPFLALPTNPIIIIPYSLIRGASVIPGPLTAAAPGVTNIDSACFILQNGALQPIAYSLASQANQTQNSVQQSRGVTPNNVAMSSSSQQSSAESKSTNDGDVGEVLKTKNKKEGPARETTTPLDLSVRRLSPLSNNRDRSLSISSAISAEQLRMDFEQLLESKENRSVSGDSVTPEQIVCAPSLPGSPPLTPSPKRRSHSPRGSNASLSPSSINHHLQLPNMKSFLPADIAFRLSESGLHSLAQLPQLPQMLSKHDVELALRISSANSSNSDASPKQISPLNHPHSSPSPNTPSLGGMSPAISSLPPQIFVKQGVSKCMACNIVFCKYENYLAHKKHYCSARNVEDAESGGSGGSKISPPVSPQAKSPSGGALSYQQLICAACGIKFTSLDNLSAHQMYYCPKRLEIQVQLPVKERCGKCKTVHEPGQPCAVGGPGSYKCPICEVISPNSAEARRHMETHAGVKAFRCSICSYKGNTLRGMRTHIRMHFDKKTVDFNEENYITCILEEDGVEIATAKAPSPVIGGGGANAQQATNENSAQMHYCDMCHYSSSYKGNVVRHTRLVHSQAQPPSHSPVIGEGGENLLHNGETSKSQNSIVKLEPHDDKSNDVEIIVDEPDIQIKTETVERPNSVTPTLRPQSRPNSQPNNHRNPPPISPISLQQQLRQPQLQPHEISTPSVMPQPSPTIVDNGQNHCKTCDIKFNYVNTFLAHKKFYCKTIVSDDMTQVASPPPSAPANNVRAKETTVL